MTADNASTGLPGYPPDARLLILNADDFGMCHAINTAIMQTIREGVMSSTTLMVPCPWSLHAIHLLKANPDISFGVHLTAISEWESYRWGPVVCRDTVPSLLDEAGCFYRVERMDEFLDQVNIDELEREFRAQIDHVLAAGLKPTHLDSHCGTHEHNMDIFEMVFGLAREYGLALRVGTPPDIDRVKEAGLPANMHPITDSYRLAVENKADTYSQMLRDLPPGLTEWAIHPGIGNEELKALSDTWVIRQSDLDFFTSDEARQIIAEEGIQVVDYVNLQPAWRKT
jgi:hypothetical protein